MGKLEDGFNVLVFNSCFFKLVIIICFLVIFWYLMLFGLIMIIFNDWLILLILFYVNLIKFSFGKVRFVL